MSCWRCFQKSGWSLLRINLRNLVCLLFFLISPSGTSGLGWRFNFTWLYWLHGYLLLVPIWAVVFLFCFKYLGISREKPKVVHKQILTAIMQFCKKFLVIVFKTPIIYLLIHSFLHMLIQPSFNNHVIGVKHHPICKRGWTINDSKGEGDTEPARDYTFLELLLSLSQALSPFFPLLILFLSHLHIPK